MIHVRYDASLKEHNSFHLDVKAAQYAEYSSVEDLQAFLPLRDASKPLFHIGGGNNLLFTHDFDGIILHSAIRGVERVEEDSAQKSNDTENVDWTADTVLLRVGAGEVWDELVEHTIRDGLYGLENLSLIPSEVGAAAVQNIGAYGAEAKDVIEKVEVVSLKDGSVRTFSNRECAFAYRYSNFKGPWRGQYAVTHVYFRLSTTFRPNLSYKAVKEIFRPDMTAADLRRAIISIRQNKLPDPKEIGNAGSFFMNPVISKSDFARLQAKYPDVPHYNVAVCADNAENGAKEGAVKVPAAWLIEQAGWKGRNLGRAGVYEKQPLVLVNRGGATAEEIMHLSDAVCHDVKEKFGIEIRPEVNWI